LKTDYRKYHKKDNQEKLEVWKMEKFTFDNDITVFYITANSFPEGIMDAHKKLHSIVPTASGRRFFGISRPEKGVIIYKAAAEEINQGEANKLKCKTLVIKKGNYVCITIKDYTKDVLSIDKVFQKLTSISEIDPSGYCIEWYLNDTDVKCMIRLKD
jgi:hypothetical protein